MDPQLDDIQENPGYDTPDAKIMHTQVKDACTSPIHVIESFRHHNLQDTLCSDVSWATASEAWSEQTLDHGQESPRSSTIWKQHASETEHGKAHFSRQTSRSTTEDDFDCDIAVNMTPEEYYDNVRRKERAKSSTRDVNSYADVTATAEEKQNIGEQQQHLRRLYNKLTRLNDVTEETMESEEVTLAKLEVNVEMLIKRMEESDDHKMVKRCQMMFQNNKLPLNQNIEGLRADFHAKRDELSKMKRKEEKLMKDLYNSYPDEYKIRQLSYENTELQEENKRLTEELEGLKKQVGGVQSVQSEDVMTVHVQPKEEPVQTDVTEEEEQTHLKPQQPGSTTAREKAPAFPKSIKDGKDISNNKTEQAKQDIKQQRASQEPKVINVSNKHHATYKAPRKLPLKPAEPPVQSQMHVATIAFSPPMQEVYNPSKSPRKTKKNYSNKGHQ